MQPQQLGVGLNASSAPGKTWRGGQFFGDDWKILSRPGDASNSELQYYLPSNVTVDGNNRLNITAKSDTSQAGYSYTSAMLQWSSYSFLYGTLKCRAQMPGGTGCWPAVWLLGRNCEVTNITTPDNTGTCSWPDPGSDEVDFIEFLNSDYSHANQIVHMTAGNPGGPVALGVDASAGFHDYEWIWKPGSLVWKVDGTVTSTITSNVPADPMFVIMNVAVGGVGGGTVNAGTLPQSMVIDYLTVIP